MQRQKLKQVVLSVALLTVPAACHTATKTVGGAVSGTTNAVAGATNAVTGTVTGTVDRFRSADVKTETMVWTYEDAKVQCPKVAEKHQGKWNGKWKLIKSGQASTCGVIGGFTN